MRPALADLERVERRRLAAEIQRPRRRGTSARTVGCVRDQGSGSSSSSADRGASSSSRTTISSGTRAPRTRPASTALKKGERPASGSGIATSLPGGQRKTYNAPGPSMEPKRQPEGVIGGGGGGSDGIERNARPPLGSYPVGVSAWRLGGPDPIQPGKHATCPSRAAAPRRPTLSGAAGGAPGALGGRFTTASSSSSDRSSRGSSPPPPRATGPPPQGRSGRRSSCRPLSDPRSP